MGSYAVVVSVSTWTALAVASLALTVVALTVRPPAYSIIAAVLDFVTAWSSGMVGETMDVGGSLTTVYYPSYTIYGVLFAGLGVVMCVTFILKTYNVMREVVSV